MYGASLLLLQKLIISWKNYLLRCHSIDLSIKSWPVAINTFQHIQLVSPLTYQLFTHSVDQRLTCWSTCIYNITHADNCPRDKLWHKKAKWHHLLYGRCDNCIKYVICLPQSISCRVVCQHMSVPEQTTLLNKAYRGQAKKYSVCVEKLKVVIGEESRPHCCRTLPPL